MEVDKDIIALGNARHARQLAVAGRCFRYLPDGCRLRLDPSGKLDCIGHRGEHKARRAADALVENPHRATASAGQELGPAVVGGDQGRLGGGEWDHVFAPGKMPVDFQRADNTDRNFHCAHIIFDVPAIERVPADTDGITDLELCGNRRLDAAPESADRLCFTVLFNAADEPANGRFFRHQDRMIRCELTPGSGTLFFFG